MTNVVAMFANKRNGKLDLGFHWVCKTVQWRNQECSDGQIFKVDTMKEVLTDMCNHLRSDHPNIPHRSMEELVMQ